MTLPVAVDAMGTDRGPAEMVAGARQAAEEHGIEVVLVGQPDVLAGFDTGGLEIVAASEVVEMADDPVGGIRRKRDSSVVRSAELVRDGRACAMFSAGNTGAAVASATLRMGRISGVARPAIATTLPVPGRGYPNILLDSGGNAECFAPWLVQWAQMGSVYAAARFDLEAPRVGLISIGEEPSKGTALVKETHALLAAPGPVEAAGGRFIGNVEGRDALTDTVDVMVTDGFTGNVVLKTLEGATKVLVTAFLGVLGSSDEARKASEVLVPALLPLYEEMDVDTYGGAMLLGVDGVCIIGHGKSTPKAVVNALRLAAAMVETDLVGGLRKVIASSAG
ncbi:MAG: phosphate acyltransferase PlsX [Actinomycetota bacterium]|jgi:phosphate acyltransferase